MQIGEQGRGEAVRREALVVGLLLVAAAALRGAYLLQYLADCPYATVPLVDSAYYDAWAQRVAAGAGYGPTPFYLAPLYPTLLGGLYAVAGRSVVLVIGLQSALGVVNVLLAYLLGRRAFGHPAGLAAGVLLLLAGPVLALESKLLSETVGISLALSALLVLSRAVAGGRWPAFLAAGVLVGLATLARANTLLFGGLAVLWLATQRARGAEGARWWQPALVAAGIAAAVLPVSVRNRVAGGEFVLVSANGGMVLAQGNHPGALGLAAPVPGMSGRVEQQQEEEVAIASRALGRRVSRSEASAWWVGTVRAFAIERPAEFASLLARKLAWALHVREAREQYDPDYEARFAPVLLWLCLPFPLLAGLGAYGAWRGRRGRSAADATLIGLYVLASVATLVAFMVSTRYRAPIVPPLAVLAGAGVVAVADDARRRDFRALAVALACLVVAALPSLAPYPVPRESADAPTNAAAALLASGRTDEALALLDEALATDPDYAGAHYNRGLALLRRGDRDGAVAEFAAVARLKPEDARARNNLASLLDEAGRTAEAIPEYRAAIERAPDLAEPHCNLAIALYATRALDDAAAEVDACRRLGGTPDPAFVDALARRRADGGRP